MNAWNSAARHDGYLITPIGQQARQNEFVTFWEQETTGSWSLKNDISINRRPCSYRLYVGYSQVSVHLISTVDTAESRGWRWLTLFRLWQTRPSWRKQLWGAQVEALSPWSERMGATVWKPKRSDCHHRTFHLRAAENPHTCIHTYVHVWVRFIRVGALVRDRKQEVFKAAIEFFWYCLANMRQHMHRSHSLNSAYYTMWCFIQHIKRKYSPRVARVAQRQRRAFDLFAVSQNLQMHIHEPCVSSAATKISSVYLEVVCLRVCKRTHTHTLTPMYVWAQIFY